MFFIPTCIVLLAVLLYWAKLTSDANRFAKDIPGPKSYPLIGCAHLLVGSEEYTFKVVCELFRKYTRMFRLTLGPKTIVCLSDPELIQQALTAGACQNKAFFYRFLEMDYGLVSARYGDWKQYRKMLNPAFNQRILVSFISIFSRCSNTMVARMGLEERHGRPFDALYYTAQCTLEMVCASSLKSDITNDPHANLVCHGLEKIAAIMSSRVFNVLLYSDLFFAMTQRYREMQRERVHVKAVVDPILFKRRDEIHQQRAESVVEDQHEETYRKPMVFLDQLLNMQRNGQELAMEEIENHLYTIIGAGSETTANQVGYIIWLLAMHPAVQDRVYKEIQSVYGADLDNISYESLASQTYLEQVIKESMRLFPVAPLIGRETIEPMTLGNVVIPAGVTILINILNLHRREDLWGERAHLFDPERFDPATYEARKSHPYSYIPFGGGPRNCIGYRYGMLAMKVMVTKVVSAYQLSTHLTLNDPLRLSFAVTLKLGVGHLINIKRR
ncbi:cytochrome P450 4d1-like [Anopheles ziemanni]|uniref:cytochrome P450 4d1-like n=1 Tax=Anopheles coustani TaxID=139045 RepID=UPI00265B4E3F|nr:cytochrome P450 4d1-like [Anopheles coustani]XP_058175386.1 cytochrome P450 4d1-like [Anopheles ziemanni]